MVHVSKIMIYPLSFGIPEEKILETLQLKEQDFSIVIPGNRNNYIYSDENDYYTQYQKSKIALTFKKGGWDCLRHYEILANGCIPWFAGLSLCPSNALTHLPKQLILEAMNQIHLHIPVGDIFKDNIKSAEALYFFSADSDIQPTESKFLSIDHVIQYYSSKLLEYTRDNLSTRSMANYILQSANKNDTKSVLFFAGNLHPDYMMNLTLHGFKKLLGKSCHEYPHIDYMYTDYDEKLTKNLYGRGFTYTRLLDKEVYYDPKKVNTIQDDIVHHRYDLVIYGSVHRGLAFYDLVKKYYYPNEIIYICGEDAHGECEFKHNPSMEHLFIRELS